MTSFSSSTAIVTFNEETQLSTPADLRRLTDTPGMTQMIKDTYGKIDLDETFRSLIDCGKMLQIALTASGDQPCSKDILLILSKYQNLVHDSTVTSHKFVNASIQALQRHKDAIEILGFTEPEQLVEMFPDVLGELVKCYDTATEMKKEAGAAAANVDAVTVLAESALISAKNDLGTNAQKKKEVQEQIDNMKAEEAANSLLLEKYSSAVTELGQEKRDAAKEAARARDRAFALDMTAAVLGSLTSMAEMYASATQPTYIAGKAAGNLTGGENNSNSTPADNNVQRTGTGTSSVMNDDLLTLEKDVNERQLLLEQAEKRDDAETPDGKKKIEEARTKLDVAKQTLENTKNALSKVAENQQNSAANLEEKAAMLSKRYYEMVEKEAQTAAEQAKNIEFLKNMKHEATFVEQAIFLLQFSYGILGSVKTTFLNIKTFWELLAIECKKIADMKAEIEDWGQKVIRAAESATGDDVATSKLKMYGKYKGFFTEKIVRSGQSWAGVGRVSLNAYDAITDARATVDSVMMKLPTGKVSEEALLDLISTIEPRIQQKVLMYKDNSPRAIEDGHANQ